MLLFVVNTEARILENLVIFLIRVERRVKADQVDTSEDPKQID